MNICEHIEKSVVLYISEHLYPLIIYASMIKNKTILVIVTLLVFVIFVIVATKVVTQKQEQQIKNGENLPTCTDKLISQGLQCELGY